MKILRNNKGLSLVEIMVALGLIGILGAVAVPQFRKYQRDARYGVVRSMLTVPYRTFEVQESLGHNIASLSEGFLWARIKSKDKGDFSKTFSKNAGNTKWCLKVEGKTGTSYENFHGCVNEGGNTFIGGTNTPCELKRSYRKDTSVAQDGSSCADTGCGVCELASPHSTNCTAGMNEEKKCRVNANGTETYSETINCTGGECS